VFEISRCRVISVASQSHRETIDYGVRMVGAPLEWNETMGEGVKVGIIDTGICTSHIELRNRIKDGANFSGGSRDDIEDENGHGTHVRCTGK